MLKKIVFTVSLIFISLVTMAQGNLNDYKYIIVPKKYDFLKGEDQYQINSLTKYLFNKYGYRAYFEDETFPDDLKNNRCLALTSEVSNEKSGMFKSKLEIILKDCFSKVIITSEIGESRLKKYDRAYSEALRNAFVTFEKAEYQYVPKENTNASMETMESKTESEEEPVIEEKPVVKPNKSELTEKIVVGTVIKANTNTSEIYYAQTREDGYQLVDSEPKIVMVLLKTSVNDVFMVKDKNAIVYKENGSWYYYENNGSVVKKVINIKF